MQSMLRSLWQYRHFLLSSVRNELSVRFAQNKLGAMWILINPLAQVLIYTLILSNVLAAKLPGIENSYSYAIYLMAGLLAWNLFTEIISGCSRLFIEQGNLMKKMNFPRVTLPIILLGTCIINNLCLLFSMLIIFMLLGHFPTLAIIWLLPLMFLVTSFALGLGLILGVLNVFIRDIGQMIPILLQVLFWFTPIIYPETIIPENYRIYFKLNPLYVLTNAYQDVLVYGNPPALESLAIIISITAVLLFLSLVLFRRASSEMVDVL